MKFDMHCHTKEGSPDGKIPLLEAVRLLREKGYHGMLITDHNSYKAYRYYLKHREEPEFDGFVVLKGIEYDTIDAGHILVVMPTGVKLPILELRGLPVGLLTDIVHHFGGILGPAHPCGEKYLSLMHTKRRKKSRELLAKFDFFETYNSCESPESNEAAKELAKRFDRPGTGGSDFHKRESTGLGYTEIDAVVKNEDDLIHAMRSDVKITAGGEPYLFTTKQRIGKANSLLVYAFWLYNRALALFRRHKRRLELLENHLYAYTPKRQRRDGFRKSA